VKPLAVFSPFDRIVDTAGMWGRHRSAMPVERVRCSRRIAPKFNFSPPGTRVNL
jgi:hypothetical protein